MESQTPATNTLPNIKLTGTLLFRLLVNALNDGTEDDYNPNEEEGFVQMEITEEMIKDSVDEEELEGPDFDSMINQIDGMSALKPLREARILQLLDTVNIDALSYDHFSLLHFACLFGSRSLFDAVVHHTPLLFQRTRENRYSPIDIAIRFKHQDLALALINDTRMTREELLREPTVDDMGGKSASVVAEALFSNNEEIIRAVFLKVGMGFCAPLTRECIDECSWRGIRILHDLGFINLDTKITRNWSTTFLHILVEGDELDEELLDRLLQVRHILNLPDGMGDTPLHVAAKHASEFFDENMYPDIVEGLLEERERWQGVICKMLDAGCNPHTPNREGILPDFSSLPVVTEWLNSKEQMNAASLFVTTVCFSDGYFEIKPSEKGSPVGRFFRIAEILPMDLQTILCIRAYGRTEDFVPRSLTKQLWGPVLNEQQHTQS